MAEGNARIVHITSGFTIVPNEALNDSKLSFRAKGVYAFLRSKPDNWEFRMSNIILSSTEGRDAIRAAIKELETAGYVKREPCRNDTVNKFDGWVWYIYEKPI